AQRLQALEMAVGLLKKPRVLQRYADDVADRLQQFDFSRRKRLRPARCDVQNSHDTSAGFDRNTRDDPLAVATGLTTDFIFIVDDQRLSGRYHAGGFPGVPPASAVRFQKFRIARRDPFMRRQDQLTCRGILEQDVAAVAPGGLEYFVQSDSQEVFLLVRS